jgi:HlyD family secretion protein
LPQYDFENYFKNSQLRVGTRLAIATTSKQFSSYGRKNIVTEISKLPASQRGQNVNLSGQGMDRRVEKKVSLGSKLGYVAAGVMAIAFAWWLTSTLMGGRSLSVNSERIAVSAVTEGTFEDFIPLRGRLVPRSTVYLDAIEGGRVEEIFVEDGVLVSVGDPIARLSNTNLQLEVLGREAAVTEQLNNLRTIELQQARHYSREPVNRCAHAGAAIAATSRRW